MSNVLSITDVARSHDFLMADNTALMATIKSNIMVVSKMEH